MRAPRRTMRRIRTCRRRFWRPTGTSPRRRGPTARGRCAGIPARRARDPRRRRTARARAAVQRRSAYAVLAALLGAAEQNIQAGRTSTGRAGDQRRGDLDYRARHSRGHRFRACAHQPLQSAQPPAAPADRAGVARERGAAQGALRPHRPRIVRAPVFASGFRGAPELHRARGAAHQSRRAAAAPGGGRIGRGGDFPVHRSAGFARA